MILFIVAITQGAGYEGNMGEDSSEPLFFKLLCPQGITGLIIGKGGANIIQLNATTGARIKLSQNNEYFPNTTDRILLSKCQHFTVTLLCCLIANLLIMVHFSQFQVERKE